MYWKSKEKNTFDSRALIDFAAKYGWQLTDSILIPHDELLKWTTNGKTFPFWYSEYIDGSINGQEFPNWINSDIKLYRFKTGWIAVEPGNAMQTGKSGYIVINKDGSELQVYHLWGE